jgi:hypothetical protein
MFLNMDYSICLGRTFILMEYTKKSKCSHDPYGELVVSTLTGASFTQEIDNDPYGELVVSNGFNP